ncbi:MAG: GGDEF domain-containing protein, partial [Propionibacteriaceae bacterium]|nr:GGDEF domain-containing protein [Propionibacteriaceae bacterium]
RFSSDGILLEANRGFLQAVEVPQGVVRLTDLVIAGQADGPASALATRRGSPVRRHVLFATGAGAPVSLLASWAWDGEELVLVGEPPVTDAATTQARLLKLNQQVSDLALENARKGAQLERALGDLQTVRASMESQAWRDDLTGLAGRRWLEEILELECERTKRYAQPFCVVMAEVDGFMTIRDSFGQAAADQVLKAVAEALTEAVRLTDVVGRYGGHKFLTMLSHSALEPARMVTERMRAGVAATPPAFRPEPVTASFGIAQFLPGDTVASLVERAENALAAAKLA